MSANLDDILKGLLATSSKLSDGDRARLQNLVVQGNTLVEVLNFLARNHSPRLVSLLEPVIDEIFLDFHVSITLAMVGQFKSACVLLRTCIESALYVLYFIDHPVEAYLWANHSKDMSFSSTLAEVVNPQYFHAATGQHPPEGLTGNIFTNLQASYRGLSERVHGKYAFLQLTSNDGQSLLSTFSNLAEKCTSDLIRLSACRTPDTQSLRTEIPTVERFL